MFGVIIMISFEPLRKTLKKNGVTTYKLIKEYKISGSTIDSIRNDRPVNTTTINDLCNILDCRVEDVIVYHRDSKEEIEKRMKKWEEE